MLPLLCPQGFTLILYQTPESYDLLSLSSRNLSDMHLRHKTDSPRTGVALAAGGNMYFSPACRNTSLATKHRSALMLPLQERLTVHESANTVNPIVRCFNFKACKAPDLCLPKWSSQLECVHGILVFWLSAVAARQAAGSPPHRDALSRGPLPPAQVLARKAGSEEVGNRSC